ncbi:ORF79 [Ranid herpesvirus 2]|uniref:ORF79 n=1 Tax=Ranid herpesvirus 2 TaxID=389214 RepID=Q14W27_9VIRU|nr:ORF79 [Ranid herpesvirus 2]ABG25639.1 ORF79 [Ranid herpesvirus 2]
MGISCSLSRVLWSGMMTLGRWTGGGTSGGYRRTLQRVREVREDQEEVQRYVNMKPVQRITTLSEEKESIKKKMAYYEARKGNLSAEEALQYRLLQQELVTVDRATTTAIRHLVDKKEAKSDLKETAVQKYHLQNLTGLYEVSKLSTASAVRCQKKLMELERKESIIDMTLEGHRDIQNSMEERRSERRVRFEDEETQKAIECLDLIVPSPPSHPVAKFDTIDERPKHIPN